MHDICRVFFVLLNIFLYVCNKIKNMNKFNTLKELLERIRTLLPLVIIEGEEDEPISTSNLIIEIKMGLDFISIHYSKNCYHFENINNLINVYVIECDENGFSLDENDLIEEFEFFLECNFTSKYKICKQYEE
jgi:hypothetical protein